MNSENTQAAAAGDRTSVPVAGKIDNPSAWTAASLVAETGLLRFDDACLAELDAVAGALRDNPLPIIALRPADFAMPQCRALMARARAELQDGVGYVLLEKLPSMPAHRDVTTALYWLLASMIARPVAQKWDGRMIYDVRDTGKKPEAAPTADASEVVKKWSRK